MTRSYHGTGEQAIEFALDDPAAWSFERQFLKDWQQGDLDEWPEFYVWLDSRPQGGNDD